MTSPLIWTLEKATPELQSVAHEKGLDRTTERDLQRAFETASGARSAAFALASWPNVGRVDVEMPGATGVELKWCRSGDTLSNCAWDVAKLSVALAEGRIGVAFIVAGAPLTHWNQRERGAELFDNDVFASADLVERYESWWRFWCKDVLTRPLRLPRSISVSDVGRIPVTLAGSAYALRVARVALEDSTWRTHVCPHRWRGERCRPRPWDRDGWGGLPPT